MVRGGGGKGLTLDDDLGWVLMSTGSVVSCGVASGIGLGGCSCSGYMIIANIFIKSRDA